MTTPTRFTSRTKDFRVIQETVFFTESGRTEPTLYDMELNYIASFSPHLELVAAVKIVSDNLSVDAFLNNAIRESGVLTSDKVWANVKQAVETILSRNQDKKR